MNRPYLENRLHRMGWCVAAALLALASCRGGQAMQVGYPNDGKSPGALVTNLSGIPYSITGPHMAMLADDGTPEPWTPTVPAKVYAQGGQDEATRVLVPSKPEPTGTARSTVPAAHANDAGNGSGDTETVPLVRPTVEQPTPSPAAVASQAPIVTPSGQLTRSQLDAVLAQAGWPRSLWAWARGITWRESRWMPGVSNPSGASGLWEIMPATWAAQGCAGDPSDALANSACAWKLYQQEGARPWGG